MKDAILIEICKIHEADVIGVTVFASKPDSKSEKCFSNLLEESLTRFNIHHCLGNFFDLVICTNVANLFGTASWVQLKHVSVRLVEPKRGTSVFTGMLTVENKLLFTLGVDRRLHRSIAFTLYKFRLKSSFFSEAQIETCSQSDREQGLQKR